MTSAEDVPLYTFEDFLAGEQRSERRHASAPGLRQYVLVDPERRRAEVATREDGELRWQAHGPGGVVVTDHGVLDVDAVYDAVDATATT